MPDEYNINVDSPQVQAPVTIDWGDGSFIDSIRTWIDDFVDDIRKGSDEVFTGLFVGVMFIGAGLYLWRRV